MHTHKRVNALTQTRESPMERLFRGITWLLGNSVALPRRPSYFRLLICLFLCVCLRVCLSSIRFSCPYNIATVPSCFFLYTSILHASSVCVCLCVCLCVCVLLWVICGGSNVGGRCSTGTLMWAHWEGGVVPKSCKSHFSWGDPSLLSAFFFFLHSVHITN